MTRDLDAIAALVAVVCGALLALQHRAVLVAIVAVFIVVAVAIRAPRVGVVCVALACSTAAWSQHAVDGLRAPRLLNAGASRTEATVTLTSDPLAARFATNAVARLTKIAGRHTNRRLLLVATERASTHVAVLDAGDTIEVLGTLRPLRSFDSRYRWQHCFARLTVTDVVALHGPASMLARASGAARNTVVAGTDVLPEGARGVVRGFILGDTRAIAPRTTDAFRRAGMSHMLAVSGANIAFVLALVQPLLRRFALRGRFLGGLTTLVFFGAMTRWQPSVLRAIAMAIVALTATFVGRPVAGVRVFALGVTALVLADPFLVHSVGFLLSCGACAGILVFSAPIAVRLHGPRWWREAFAVTCAAQIGVAPVLIPVFGSIPLVALPANLLGAPAVGPLTIGGIACAVLATIFGHLHLLSLASAVQLPVVVLARYLSTVATVAAREPLALTGRSFAAVVMIGSALGVLWIAAPAVRSPRHARASRSQPRRRLATRPGDGHSEPHA